MRDNISLIRKRFATIVLALVLALSSVSVFSAVYSTQTVEAATVKLSKTSRTMKVGQAYKLTVKGPHGAVKWKSSKSSVAAVDNSGVVRAKKKGTANIYAQVGKKKLRCRITVKNPAPSINKKSLTIYRGGAFRLTVKYPTSKVKWSSSNKKVATVNSNGTVVAKKNGKATITAAMRGRKLRCSVVVKSAPAPSSNPVVNTPSNPIANTPAGGNGSTGTSSGGTTTPSQPSTEHVHDWELAGERSITYYCGEPLRYVCTACGQMFKNKDDLFEHTNNFIVSDLNTSDAKIYNGLRLICSYNPSVNQTYGSEQFFALGGPIHAFNHTGKYIYDYNSDIVKTGSVSYGAWTDTPELTNPSSESYKTFWKNSNAKTMVVCSCGAIFANQECLDRHIKLVNDLNTKLAANMDTTPYLHHKQGTGVECGICKATRDHTYKCSGCGKWRWEADTDFPKSLYPQ